MKRKYKSALQPTSVIKAIKNGQMLRSRDFYKDILLYGFGAVSTYAFSKVFKNT